MYNEPDASYGGAVWGKVVPELTGANVAFAVRARVVLLRDLGSALAPDNAFGIIQGLETVALRMKQHCSNAEKVVEYLNKHKNVERVIYPTLHKGAVGDRAKKYFNIICSRNFSHGFYIIKNFFNRYWSSISCEIICSGKYNYSIWF